MNMPRTLPDRRGDWRSYEYDSPLTKVGHMQANLTGTNTFAFSGCRVLVPLLLLLCKASSSLELGGPLRKRTDLLTGRALRDAGMKIDVVYCSPALRCVQTASGIVTGLGEPSFPKSS